MVKDIFDDAYFEKHRGVSSTPKASGSIEKFLNVKRKPTSPKVAVKPVVEKEVTPKSKDIVAESDDVVMSVDEEISASDLHPQETSLFFQTFSAGFVGGMMVLAFALTFFADVAVTSLRFWVVLGGAMLSYVLVAIITKIFKI
ncbi:MAG: hypothetical protein ACMXYK_00515 [Candidatus Woesearchaeota archaeon]